MDEIWTLLERIRSQKPLIHHITNWVTIYDCANVTRTIGALPVMAHSEEEVEQMASIAGALVLNIGTLTTQLVESMRLAAKAANKRGIPVILDAVGAGATDFRTRKVNELLNSLRIDIIKGNAGEIATIAGIKAEVKGVESVSHEGKPVEIAKKLAKERRAIVVITGKQDIVTNGKKTYLINNGDAMMGKIVGTGCMAASVIASFCAVEKDYAKAAAAALAYFGVAGELAAKKSKGPGSFKEAFFDELYNMNEETLRALNRVVEA